MPEFQLTHVALVGARMPVFQPFGYHNRNELAMRRVSPLPEGQSLTAWMPDRQRRHFNDSFPVWVHNIIVDPEFPSRPRYLQSLRRFEGELRDGRSDEVVSAVLSAGFRNQPMDPLVLPEAMPLRQRCALVMNVGVWQEAFRQFQETLLELLCADIEDIDSWLESIRIEGCVLLD